MGSIAATGFGLTALASEKSAGLFRCTEARTRVLATLVFLWKKLPNHRGFFYHFANINTGERIWDSEISSVDTAILLCGVLTCREHFHAAEISDWRRHFQPCGLDMAFGRHLSAAPRVGARNRFSALSLGLLQRTDDDVSSRLGSTSYPLAEETWNAWKRTTFEYEGLRYIGSFAPFLCTNIPRPGLIFAANATSMRTIFKNSAIATDVHRRFCLELAKQFPDYSDDLWGITASDSPKGYVVWGGPPEWDRSTARWFRALRRVRCPFCRSQSACAEHMKSPLRD